MAARSLPFQCARLDRRSARTRRPGPNLERTAGALVLKDWLPDNPKRERWLYLEAWIIGALMIAALARVVWAALS